MGHARVRMLTREFRVRVATGRRLHLDRERSSKLVRFIFSLAAYLSQT